MWTAPERDLIAAARPCKGLVICFNAAQRLELVPRETASALKRRLPRGRVDQGRPPSLRAHRGINAGLRVLWASMNAAR